MSLCALTLTEAAADIREGRITSAELVADASSASTRSTAKVQAWAFLDRDHAMRQAEAADEHRRQGRALGPLHGVPIGIKDIFDTGDMPTEFGSPLWAGRTPRRDAAAVARLRAAGAVIMGKTVTTEYAYFHPGKTRNPHDPERTPGGSSSGSAAAVAAHMVPGAIGSQTNGSVIRPAAFCGVVGFKPTHGLIPRSGALLLRARSIMSASSRAPSRMRRCWPRRSWASTRRIPTRGRLRVRPSPPWPRASRRCRRASPSCARRPGNARSRRPGRPSPSWSRRSARRSRGRARAGFERAIELHRTIMEVEMAHNLHRDYEKGADKLSAVLRQLIERGRNVPAVDYTRAVAGIGPLNGRSTRCSTSTTRSSRRRRRARRRAASRAPAIRSSAPCGPISARRR